MKFVFVAKHRSIWPVAWLCDALGVSRSGFHAWLNRSPSARSCSDEAVGRQVLASDRSYGARRVWRDLLAEGVICGLHRIERLMRVQALRARRRSAPFFCGPASPSRLAFLAPPGSTLRGTAGKPAVTVLSVRRHLLLHGFS